MIKDALEYLLTLRRPEIVEVGGRPYSTTSLAGVGEPQVSGFKASTLTAIRDYVAAKLDAEAIGQRAFIVQIDAPTSVLLSTEAGGPFHNRSNLVAAQAVVPDLAFGRWVDLETFNIFLQTRFVREPGLEALLRFIGNVTDKAELRVQDDGVTQETTVKAGIARVENFAIPNPVRLAPFRTFPEVPQPTSPFVLRMKRNGETIDAALFEADGGAWRCEAIANIGAYLRDHLPKTVTVLS